MKRFILVLMMFLPALSFAIVPDWKIEPVESSIRFVGAQNNAPVKGEFKAFSAKIHFDPKQLDDSLASFKIDLNSVSTSYKDFTMTLLDNDWFAVKLFPTAEFVADHFVQKSDDEYQAQGKLTIRDKTLPLSIDFKVKYLADDIVKVTGQTSLKRLDFGVGQGEWQSTSEVANEVDVYFDILAKKVVN